MGINGTIIHFVTLCQEKKRFFNTLGPFVEILNGPRLFLKMHHPERWPIRLFVKRRQIVSCTDEKILTINPNCLE